MNGSFEGAVGVFGGTFNPLHHGHLIAVQEACHRLGLGRVLFVPTARPPHKDPPEVGPELRVEMVRRVLRDRGGFSVSDIELEREGPSYTVDTLRALSQRHPDRRLVLMTGADELIDFTSWHRWEDVLERAGLVGMNRPGFDRSAILAPVREACRFVDVPSIQISSSRIRRRLREGEPARWFVPETVWDFIRTHGLYGVS